MLEKDDSLLPRSRRLALRRRNDPIWHARAQRGAESGGQVADGGYDERNRSYSGNLGTVSIDADGDLTWTYDADTDQAIAYVRVSGPFEEGSAFIATKNEPLPEP